MKNKILFYLNMRHSLSYLLTLSRQILFILQEAMIKE